MTHLTDLRNQADQLEDQLNQVKDAIQIEASRLADTVSSRKLNKADILTNTDGRSVLVSDGELFDSRKVWEFNNGVRGKTIKVIQNITLRRVRIAFANGEF